MDIFDEDILELWRCLHEHLVKYIMVGGFATNLNGFQRFTADLDLWVEDSVENRKKLRSAFKHYGFGDLKPLERMPFVPGCTYFTLNNGLRLDIMSEMKGLEGFTFDESLAIANIAEIENIPVPFLHIDQLIANKKAVNRPKDQLDVIELERIKKLLDDNDLR